MESRTIRFQTIFFKRTVLIYPNSVIFCLRRQLWCSFTKIEEKRRRVVNNPIDSKSKENNSASQKVTLCCSHLYGKFGKALYNTTKRNQLTSAQTPSPSTTAIDNAGTCHSSSWSLTSFSKSSSSGDLFPFPSSSPPPKICCRCEESSFDDVVEAGVKRSARIAGTQIERCRYMMCMVIAANSYENLGRII